jgi:hypothetical protein
MPEMQNLNNVWVFPNAVIHENRCVNELPHAGPAGDRRADIGKRLQQIQMIQ